MATSAPEDRTLELEDGRHLAYTVFGDPAGRPCLFVHGFSSSRWAAGWTLGQEHARRHGVRLIAVDRPGYGRSTARPGRGFLAWAHDASALADHLGLDRLAVIGVSMGAAPALALAALRPDLVSSATVLSGMPPIDPGERWRPDSRSDALYWALARHAPGLLGVLCATSARAMASAADGDPGRLVGQVERTLPEADRRVLRELLVAEHGDARAAFAADVRESSRQGGAAMVDDLRRHLRPWGFDPAEVRGPVFLWHGLDDPKVPVSLARRLADRLPTGKTRFVPGGHLAAFAHRDEIFDQITSAWSDHRG
ncbi:Pimeloyl-ACP methyl ester carboxylesterase [Streptoalloteichus tenebrarius]|uniref:Pimeloyl-ACP methyl ester carboxylesterase n=1 Tax=Streptoalloteichus tenebrarius (strain ATCC 17920 / DSM 40477 / JCM 4838 / CBS 697.72 / NBRC 16177 / NCIMB 11028 / NRRL B-12390 / A12253. 1 / ISP 5477) TaxID=1933 RepID=A0ABT1HLU3_STRSD|nr:alpha/beta hydrolase [Streptoalloteichus tenebrarius]MCP2256487.1 Pimeloyl-ACP methyl ester carboxylesterase [Streptoalloteichus tenebrarius]BFF04839.1 alpha/beta hydrolase [Streptoalloteichus tenebrarius]